MRWAEGGGGKGGPGQHRKGRAGQENDFIQGHQRSKIEPAMPFISDSRRGRQDETD